MSILIVGMGSIGKRHLKNLIESGRKEILICDREKGRLDQVLQDHPKLPSFEDYREAFKERPGVVYICTPPHIHTEIMEKAVTEGCHVFCEKPLAMDLRNLDAVEREAKRKGLTIMVAYVYRFFDPIKKIREIIDSNALGRIYSARTVVSLYLPDWHPWEDYRTFFLSQKALGGGALLEESHATDYIKWLMGRVVSVACFTRKISTLHMDCEDIATMCLEFENGSIATIQVDLLGRVLRREAEFSGEKGTIIWDGERNLVRLYTVEKGSWEEFPLRIRPEAYIEQNEHFFDCISEGKDPLVPLRDGIETLRICLAAFKSSDERRVVRIDEIDESTIVKRCI